MYIDVLNLLSELNCELGSLLLTYRPPNLIRYPIGPVREQSQSAQAGIIRGFSFGNGLEERKLLTAKLR
jgi:hypothetical protein